PPREASGRCSGLVRRPYEVAEVGVGGHGDVVTEPVFAEATSLKEDALVDHDGGAPRRAAIRGPKPLEGGGRVEVAGGGIVEDVERAARLDADVGKHDEPAVLHQGRSFLPGRAAVGRVNDGETLVVDDGRRFATAIARESGQEPNVLAARSRPHGVRCVRTEPTWK